MPRFYFEVARTAYRRQLVYRWANLAGMATNIFFGAVVSYVYVALFHARASAAGYGLRDALRYVWLVQAMLMVVTPFGWFDLAQTIRTGEVAADLAKPCDFYWYWFSREAGRAVYYLIFRMAPIYLGGMLLFGVGAPDGWGLWLGYAASLTLAAALGIAYRFLYNVMAFWMLEVRAAGTMAQTLALFFGGSYVPLAFFPPWLGGVAAWLPFSGLLNAPASMFTGRIAGGALLLELARQALWLVALTLAARGVAAVAARRVIVQGG